MKRQALAISLGDLKKIEKEILKELKDIQKLGIMKKDKLNNVRFQFDIVNYPTQNGKRIMYCSDTWEFEMLKKEKVMIL